jgi:hypothetical protein
MSAKLKSLLADNINRIGMVDPILVTKTDEDSYRIIDGEYRFRVAVENGITDIPCVVIEDAISDTEQKKQTIRMNQIKGQLSYDKFNKLIDNLQNAYGVAVETLPFELGFESKNDMNPMLSLCDEAIQRDKKPIKSYGGRGTPMVSIRHLHKIAERYLNGDRSGCFFIAYLGEDSSILLEFDNEGLRLLEDARVEAARSGTEFEDWLLSAIQKEMNIDQGQDKATKNGSARKHRAKRVESK